MAWRQAQTEMSRTVEWSGRSRRRQESFLSTAAQARLARRPLLLSFSGLLGERIPQSLVLAHQVDNLTELLDALRCQWVEHDDHMPDALLGKARKTAGDDFG
jgi:hypothetical protein